MIRGIELHNFKNYGDANIAFIKGLIVILGENGAGKSSILEAIGFALFNHTPAKFSELLKEGTSEGWVRATIISVLDGKGYEICRTFTANGTKSYEVTGLDTEFYLEGASDVVDWLTKNLGIQESPGLTVIFTNAAGIPQGSYTSAFLQTRSARTAIFDPLLGIDGYAKAAKGLREAEKVLEQNHAEYEKSAARLEGAVEPLPESRKQAKALDAQIEELESKNIELSAELDEAQAELGAYQEQAQAWQRAEEQRRIAQSVYEQAMTRAGLTKKSLDEAQTAKDKLAEHEQDYTDYQTCTGLIAGAEQTIEQIRPYIQELHQVQQEKAVQQTRTSTLFDQITNSQHAAQERDNLLEAEQLQAELEAKAKAVQEQGIELRAKAEQVKKLKVEYAKLEIAQQELAKQIEERQDTELLMSYAEDDRKSAEQERTQRQHELQSLQDQTEQLQKQTDLLKSGDTSVCPLCGGGLSASHRTELIEKGKATLDANKQRLTELDYEIEELSNEIIGAESSIENYQASLVILPTQRELDAHIERMAELEAQIKEDEDLDKQLEDLRAKYQEFMDAISKLNDPRGRRAVLLETAKNLDSLQELHRESLLKQSQLDEHEKELLGWQDKLSKAENQVRAWRNDLAKYRPGYEAYLANQQVAELYEQRQTEYDEAQKLQAEADNVRSKAIEEWSAAGLAYDPKAHEQADEYYSQIFLNLNYTIERLSSCKNRASELSTQIKELEAKGDELDRLQLSLDECAQDLTTLSLVRTALKSAGPLVGERLTQRISASASVLFTELMGGDYRGELRWSSDYEITLCNGDAERSFSQMSGGEEMCAALAVRFAFQKDLGLRIALFDEPTTNLDVQRRQELARQIAKVIGFEQLVVISHDTDAFEQVANQCIRIIRTPSGSAVYEEA